MNGISTHTAHGGQLRLLALELGCAVEDILDFSANINPDGPPASVLDALRAALAVPSTLIDYPDLENYHARLALSAYCGHDVDAIVVANGFVPLLEAALRLRPVRHCLLPVPAFSEYRRTLERAGVLVTSYASGSSSFVYDVAELISSVRRSGADAVLLANPQNPSGACMAKAEIIALSHAVPDVLVLLDEAFIDYVPQATVLGLPDLPANLVVFRSVTKFYAMPGLRIAYAVSASERACRMRDQLVPWPVSTLAEHALIAALMDQQYAQASLERNARHRRQLSQELTDIGIEVLPAAANFLLLRMPSAAEHVRERLLREHRIHVRTCATFEAMPGEYLRVAVRGEDHNMRLVHAFASVLNAERTRTPHHGLSDGSG